MAVGLFVKKLCGDYVGSFICTKLRVPRITRGTTVNNTLCEKPPNTEFFLVRIFPYSD